MTEPVFKRPELEDKECISHYFRESPSRSCERTFVNVYLWSRQYPVKWAVIEGALVFKSQNEDHLSYAFPAGEAFFAVYGFLFVRLKAVAQRGGAVEHQLAVFGIRVHTEIAVSHKLVGLFHRCTGQ